MTHRIIPIAIPTPPMWFYEGPREGVVYYGAPEWPSYSIWIVS